MPTDAKAVELWSSLGDLSQESLIDSLRDLKFGAGLSDEEILRVVSLVLDGLESD